MLVDLMGGRTTLKPVAGKVAIALAPETPLFVLLE
jgi:hypothetical protein